MTTALARPRRHPVAHTGIRLLRSLVIPTAWFWAIVVVAVVVITAILAASGVTHISVVSFARQGGVWFPFSIQIVVATSYLRVHVASGMTRRTFVVAALLSAAALAAVNALVMASGLTLERLAHGWLGWDWVLQDATLDPSGGSWPVMLLDYGLTYLTANLCGLLVGIVFYAAGAAWGTTAGMWWGILTLPLTAGPIFVVLALVATQGGPWPDRLAAYFLPTVGSAAAVGLGLAAAMAVAFVVIARRAPVARARA